METFSRGKKAIHNISYGFKHNNIILIPRSDIENRKIILDGVSYNRFTDEELEDFKTTIAYEERKKNKYFKLIEFEDFIKEREEKYGVKF